MPLAERLARMRDPEVRARILAEPNGEWDHPLASFVYETFSNMLPVREPLDWEPTPTDTMEAIARSEGRPAQEVVYDFLTDGDGHNLVSFPFTNYFNFSLDDVHDMLVHPASVWGLGDEAWTAAPRSTPAGRRSCSRTGCATAPAARVSTFRPQCGG